MVRSQRAAASFLGELLTASPPSLHEEHSHELAVAISERDTPTIYRRLMDGFSFQGISDANATRFIAVHGNAEWDVVSALVTGNLSVCPKLVDFGSYRGCGYRKSSRTCSNPSALPACPVPKLALRKGTLNEQAFSLFFFIRDVCQGDMVGYIDAAMPAADLVGGDVESCRERLLCAFTGIVGVSRKLASMMLSSLMLAAGDERPGWILVARSMIVVDSLVHNFMHRTGVLHAFKAQHRYGPNCYGAVGCEAVLRKLGVVLAIDDRGLTPRSVQHAIWRFCAGSELSICNGNNIRDTKRCRLEWCPLLGICARRTLRPKRRKAEVRP